MNYLEVINKCLVELNYKQVNAFSELIKNDHKKLMNIINVINSELCGFDNWNFLLRKETLTLEKGQKELPNNINGVIQNIIINKNIYNYYSDFEKALTSNQPAQTYSIFNDKILLPVFDEAVQVEIIYCTKNCAKNAEGEEKLKLEEATDESLIPMPFAEPLLVYGACMRLKGNPQHVRFNYWYGMYKDALANFRSKISVTTDDTPQIRMRRR